ncbi:MAG: hypothetical protein H7Y88_03765 [Phycisphaerales bacterium]|nr:hypothetical protein [Phycisphaerales bacterium]
MDAYAYCIYVAFLDGFPFRGPAERSWHLERRSGLVFTSLITKRTVWGWPSVYGQWRSTSVPGYWSLKLPLWIPTVTFALSTVWFTFATLRARRRACRAAGLCIKCRYDLSGLAPSSDGAPVPCPECGTPRSR